MGWSTNRNRRNMVLVPLLLLFSVAARADTNPEGLWITPAGHRVLVYRCDPGLCARLAGLSAQFLRETKSVARGQIAKERPRKLPVIGTLIFEHLPEDSRGGWSGTIYYPEGNNHFYGRVTLAADGALELSGTGASGARKRKWLRLP